MYLLNQKPYEYREITPYWVVRLLEWKDGNRIAPKDAQKIADNLKQMIIRNDIKTRYYDAVEARNGYAKDAPVFMAVYLNNVAVGIGYMSECGSPDYPVFIIGIGEMISIRNIEPIQTK